MNSVEQLLKDDRWVGAEFRHPRGPALVRFRSPVLGPAGVTAFHRLMSIIWRYAPEGSGEMPDLARSAEMERFENYLCPAAQDDGQAVLTAVSTFDGAREWVYYTRDLEEFGQRLSTIVDFCGEPYPIELTTDEDPTWSYLREQILRGIPTGASPATEADRAGA